MNETTLYRKYRPQSFAEVVGQDHIVDVLSATLESKKLAHAYLFAGPRGTGKTSIARIFASMLECSENDVYEIDAASNRGIDDVRELRESVRTLPFNSPYKVYIIDEVHMLTKDAFNALLKTLEEPPQHVIFILATTELDKVLDTVISRCQTFAFRRPTREMLLDTVLKISKKEGFKIERDAAELLALLGDGSFRDTLGTLQKVMSYSSDKALTVDEVEKITGAPRRSIVEGIVGHLADGNADQAIADVHSAALSGVNMSVLNELVVEMVRNILLCRVSPMAKKRLESELDKEAFKTIETLARDASRLNSRLLRSLLDMAQLERKTSIAELPLELIIIDSYSNQTSI